MKEGYVIAKWTKFSISGPPGTGKSSLLRMLFNEPPPDCHNSTPVVAVHEPRRVEITSAIASTQQTGLFWKKIDHESLKAMIAQGIKDEIRRPEGVQEGAHPFMEPNTLVKEQPPVNEAAAQPIEVANSSSDSTKPVNIKKETVQLSIISQEIVNLLPQVHKSKELYQSHWIYAVDTGGQAAFLDIAPILLRYHSVNIVTHKLNEKLEGKPKFYFSVQGKQIGVPVEQQITNLQLLESSFRSVVLIDPVNISNVRITHLQEPQVIVLGTFYDKMSFWGESLKTKNGVLWPKADQFSNTVVRYQIPTKEVIFPINTTGRSENEKRMASTLRQMICQCYIEAEVPARWFLFQLDLDQLQNTTHSNVVNTDRCLEIGKALTMNASEVKAALMYYHHLSIFLFFPEILPNVVFVHPQPLFDKLSELISISFADAVSHLKDIGIFISHETHYQLKTNGIFEESLLTHHLSHGFSADFTSHDFLKLMEHLFIIAGLPQPGHYFIPAVLPTTDITEPLTAPFKGDADPLVLTWNTPLSRGFFPTLVVQLLQPKDLSRSSLHIQFDIQHYLRSSKTQQYRNALSLSCVGEPGDVLLIDSINSIEIHYSGPTTTCYRLRDAILNLIENSKFQVECPQDVFYCSCSPRKPQHYCRINDEILTCCERYIPPRPMTLHQLAWFKAKSELIYNLELLSP